MAQVRFLGEDVGAQAVFGAARRAAMASSPSLTTWIEAMGPKTSSQTTGVIGPDLGEHRRRVEVARSHVEPLAAGEDLGALGDGALDLILHPRRAPSPRSAAPCRSRDPCRSRP